MDIFQAICAGIGGAIGGALGGVFSSKIKSKNMKAVVVVIPAVISVQVFVGLSKKQEFRDFFITPSDLELAIRKASRTLDENKAFKRETEELAVGEVMLFIRNSTKEGLKLLTANDLDRWNRLRIILAKKDKKLCAGFWTGKIDQKEMLEGLNLLSKKDVIDWMEITTRAAILKLENKSPIDFPEDSLQQGILAISKTMSPENQVKLSGILGAGANIDNDQACWALLALLEGQENLPEPQKEHFVRALSAL